MKIVTLSFDDGTIQDKRLVSILERYGLRATFHLNSGFFGQKHEIVHGGILCDHTELTMEEAKKVYRNQEIAVHTVHHPDLSKLDEKEILAEVGEDQQALEEIFEQKIIGMAYPGGGTPYNEVVMRVIRNNTSICFARTVHEQYDYSLPQNWMEWNPTCDIQSDKFPYLTEKFIESADSEEINLLYVWGHAFEFDKYDNWERMEAFAEKIASNSTLRVMTTKEVYLYANANRK